MWMVSRNGSDVFVVGDDGEAVAKVGTESDFRINRKLKHAEIIAAAPEMLEVLIDLNMLLKHEYMEEHPLTDLLSKKCKDIIQRSMKTHGDLNAVKKIRDRDTSYFERQHGSGAESETHIKVMDAAPGRIHPDGLYETSQTNENSTKSFDYENRGKL